MATILGGGGTGPAHPLEGFPGITVHIPIKGVPAGTPITIEEYVNALLGEEGKPPVIPLDVPVSLNPVQTTPFEKLTPEQIDELIGLGPQGFAGGGGTPAIKVPIPIQPTITISEEEGGAKAFVSQALVTALLDTTVNVPVTINPIITVGGSQGSIGTGIAASIAAGITAAAPQISNALSTAIGQALRSSSQVTSLFAIAGAAASGSFAAGITSASSEATAAASRVGSATLGGFTGFDASGIGASLSETFASGVASVSASDDASRVASGALGGFAGYSAYSIGVNLSNSMAQGISDGQASVINVAIRLAVNAINAAKKALGVSSPSKVFRNIGREIGSGLAEGIKDSETAISAAVDTAIDDAIERARRQVGGQVAAAELAGGLFERTTLPSRLPGGTSNIDVERTLSASLDAIRGLKDFAKEHEELLAEIEESNEAIHKEIQDGNEAIEAELKAIKDEALQKILEAFEDRAGGPGGVDITRQRIDLGGLRQQFRQQFKAIFEDLGGELQERAPKDESAEDKAKRLAENRRIQKLRDTAERRAQALDTSTEAGRTAANMILDFGQQIRDLGASMLESGVPAGRVISQMKAYRNELLAAADKMGINDKALKKLIKSLGLTDRQLRNFANAVTNIGNTTRGQISAARERFNTEIAELRGQLRGLPDAQRGLGLGTEQSRANRSAVTEALDAIRDFGQTALEAGQPLASVIKQMKTMRDALVKNLIAMGFDTKQIQQLVSLMGLSNAQLAEFAKNLADANAEAAKPTTPTVGGNVIGPGGQLPVGVRDIHVHLPFGDPEASALAVSNRMAFELSAPA